MAPTLEREGQRRVYVELAHLASHGHEPEVPQEDVWEPKLLAGHGGSARRQ